MMTAFWEGFREGESWREFERLIRFLRQNREERLFLAGSETLNNILCLGSPK